MMCYYKERYKEKKRVEEAEKQFPILFKYSYLTEEYECYSKL